MQHLLSIDDLNVSAISTLLNGAQQFLDSTLSSDQILNTLQGKVVANLFFEPSTRTLNSFEIAAKRLGALVISPQMSHSSMQKAESLLDTVLTLIAMGARFCIIRHSENNRVADIAKEIENKAHIINAGDGVSQHPTQALLDLLTIQQHHGNNWDNLRVAIIGDVLHSRVARSLINALSIMGVNDIRIIAPEYLIDEKFNQLNNVTLYQNISTGLENADVIVTLRLQKERMNPRIKNKVENFFNDYGLTRKRLQFAKNNAIILHPGPMNREVEICPEIAYSGQSRILNQVHNGVAIRMSVLSFLGG